MDAFLTYNDVKVNDGIKVNDFKNLFSTYKQRIGLARGYDQLEKLKDELEHLKFNGFKESDLDETKFNELIKLITNKVNTTMMKQEANEDINRKRRK